MRRAVLSACAAATFLSVEGGAQTAAGRSSAIAGTVADTNGRPIPDATVFAASRDASVTTDSAGRFHLGVPSGKSSITVMRIGYRAVHFDADIAPDTTVVVAIRMRAINAQALDPVEVREERLWAGLLRQGFYDRRERGFGQFIGPDEVERLAGAVTQPSHMLRNLNGITVRCPPVGACQISAGRECLSLFIDGALYRNMLLDHRVSVGQVYAFEVYRRRSLTPHEFIDPVTQCGAIVVWTRSRAR